MAKKPSSLRNNPTGMLQAFVNFFLPLVVGTMSGLGVQYPRSRDSIPSRDKRFFLFSTAPGRLWSPQNLLFNGYRVLFLRGWSVHADHSPPAIVEVKNMWSYTSNARTP
jgi:hypothetical protein